jgi:hypothetical protein
MGAAIAHCSPVMEALQYIFDQDLRAWSPQKASATNLPSVISWPVASEFRSRYVA